jgi:N-methylhydantoinase A
VEPTITDANVVLGRVGTETPLAGEVELDAGRARHALASLLGRVPALSPEALADGIVRIAVARMVGAIKEISIAKGHDPRDFALVAYGGAGPLHAALIAEELEMRRVIVPTAPGNFSAFGALISDLRRDYVRTRLLPTRHAPLAEVERVFAGLEDEAREDLVAAGIARDRITLARTLGMRYVGQSWEIAVRWPAAASVAALESAFHEAHQRRYGHAGDREAEIVNFRVAGIGAVPKPALPRWPAPGTLAAARRRPRAVSFGGETVEVAVYQRERLPGGAAMTGPAIVEEMGSTTVIPPGWTATVGPWGELVLETRSLR